MATFKKFVGAWGLDVTGTGGGIELLRTRGGHATTLHELCIELLIHNMFAIDTCVLRTKGTCYLQ